MSRALRTAAVASVLVLAACGSDDEASDGESASTEAATDSGAATTEDGTTAATTVDTASADTAATSDAGPASDTTAAPTSNTSSGDSVAGGGVTITAVDFEAGSATITNEGGEPYDLAGHWLCNRPDYVEMSPDILEPGDSKEVGLGGFRPDAGELGIYTSNDFANAGDMVAYVTWGSGGGRLSVAEEAGLWSGDPVQPGGAAITLEGDPGSAASWSV